MFAAKKPRKYWWQLRHNIGDVQVFLVQFFAAPYADPEKTIVFFGPALAFQHQAHRARWPLWGMRHLGWQQKYFAFADGHINRLAVFEVTQVHCAFELIEKLFAFIDMIIGAGIGAAHDRNHEFTIFPDLPVAHGRLEQVAVFVDPFFEVEWFHRFIARQCISAQWQWGWAGS